MPRSATVAAAFAVIGLVWAGGASSADVMVLDGDSLRIGGQAIRLLGIDAPELDQLCRSNGRPWPCGEAARAALRELVDGASVTCHRETSDGYGRLVATCWARGVDLGEWMVGAGLAVAYRRYSERYIQAEAAAKAARRGIWSGEFTSPEAWRRRR